MQAYYLNFYIFTDCHRYIPVFQPFSHYPIEFGLPSINLYNEVYEIKDASLVYSNPLYSEVIVFEEVVEFRPQRVWQKAGLHSRLECLDSADPFSYWTDACRGILAGIARHRADMAEMAAYCRWSDDAGPGRLLLTARGQALEAAPEQTLAANQYHRCTYAAYGMDFVGNCTVAV